MATDETSPEAPNRESISPKPHNEEAIEVQLHDQIDNP